MEKMNVIERNQGEVFCDWIERLLGYAFDRDKKHFGVNKEDVYFKITGVDISPVEARKRLYMLRDLLPILRVEGVNESVIEEFLQNEYDGLENEEERFSEISSMKNTETKNGYFREVELVAKEIEGSEDGEVEYVESEEEFRPVRWEDHGDVYIVSSKKRTIRIDKKKVRDMKRAYCDVDGLTINQLIRKFDISRRNFFLVKNAFNITHDDAPFLDEEFESRDINSMVDESIESRKERYFTKLEQEEIRKSLKELKKYREKQYLYELAMDRINHAIIIPESYKVREYEPDNCEAVLDLADMHIGMRTSNYWNHFDYAEAIERFNRLLDLTIKKGVMHNIKVLHVNLLGDLISGIIHDSLRAENEFDINEQVELTTELVGEGLIKLASVFKELRVADTAGNHGRIFANKTANGDKDNFERFLSWGLRLKLQKFENIIFEDNMIDQGIISKEVMGRKIFCVHGHEDKFNKVAEDLTMMIEKPDEIHMGHLHQNKSRDAHGVEVFICRSFCGVDNFAKSIRATGKAGQKMYIYNDDGTRAVYDFVLN